MDCRVILVADKPVNLSEEEHDARAWPGLSAKANRKMKVKEVDGWRQQTRPEREAQRDKNERDGGSNSPQPCTTNPGTLHSFPTC